MAVSAIGEPDLLVFDLDPGPPATVVECCAVARLLRPLLTGLGLDPVAKTSGGKGLQLYAAVSGMTSQQTSDLAKDLAERLEEEEPKLVVSRMTKALRPRQGAHRLEPEQRGEDHGRALLAARTRTADRVDAGQLG